MNIVMVRELPGPDEVKNMLPLSSSAAARRDEFVSEIESVFKGDSGKFILVVGPCSADNEDAVVDYMLRLRAVQEKVRDSLLIIPRLYTNKPRTAGIGYKGMLHQPNPVGKSDLYNGLLASRRLFLRVLSETGFFGADEMLYPENQVYFSDLLSYAVVGARSVENQQHRQVASGLDIPVGLKNPMSGNLSVLAKSVKASQAGHDFIYRNWAVSTSGNGFAHAILRGYVDSEGKSHSNCSLENLLSYNELCLSECLRNPSVIVDCNHSNSGKNPLGQARIALDVMQSRRLESAARSLVKGLMIESYIEDGCQKPGDGVYGRSLTDSCLGWDKTERLIYELADLK